MKRLINLFLLTICIFSVFFASSCDSSQEDIQTEPPVLERASKPQVMGKANLNPATVLIYGKTEKDSTVVLRSEDGKEEANKSSGEYFYIRAVTNKDQTVYLRAETEGKNASEEVAVNISYVPDAPETKVFCGRNSKLYYTDTIAFHEGEYETTDSFLRYTTSSVKRDLNKIRVVAKKDTEFIFIFAPNPVTIYCDEQYDDISNEQKSTPAMQFAEVMNGVDGVNIPDIRTVFSEHKDEKIFLSTDTHWTEIGAFYAYEEIMKIVKEDFPNAVVRELDDFELTYNNNYGGDFREMLGLTSMEETIPLLEPKFEQTGEFFTVKRDPEKNFTNYPRSASTDIDNPTMYFIADSYGAALLPYMGMGFSEVTVNPSVLWDYEINYDIIREKRPDYVIFCFTERSIEEDLAVLNGQNSN